MTSVQQTAAQEEAKKILQQAQIMGESPWKRTYHTRNIHMLSLHFI